MFKRFAQRCDKSSAKLSFDAQSVRATRERDALVGGLAVSARSAPRFTRPTPSTCREGRLVLDEPTALPEGAVVELVADDEGDDLTNKERRALHGALSASWKSTEAGRLRPASAILDELRQRR